MPISLSAEYPRRGVMRCAAARPMRRSLFVALLWALAMAAWPAPVQAQAPEQSVYKKPRPELDALGLRAGAFTIYPQVEVEERYDDNIFATDSGTKDDFITTVIPSISARSNWENHLLQADVYGRLNFFADDSSQDTQEGGVSASGRVDITRRSHFRAGGFYRHEVESRTEPDENGFRKPTELDRILGGVGFEQRFARFGFAINAEAQQVDFAVNADDDRDRQEYRIFPRVFYEVNPNIDVFVEPSYRVRDFEDSFDDTGVDRDSDTVEVVVGTTVDFERFLVGEAFAGYFRTDFDDATLNTVEGFAAGASLLWNVTDLTSIIFKLTRQDEATTAAGASARIRTSGNVRVEHELLRNLLLEGEASYLADDFRGVNRDDDTFGILLGARYLLNRYADASLNYSYFDRSSNVGGADYSKNIILARLRIKY